MSLKLFPKLFFHYFSPTIFRQSFSTQRLLPKSSILSAHSIKVKNDALLKSIRIFENKKPHVKSKYVAEVEEIVKGLQPRGFLAPLNPCPVYNEKFGQKRKIRSIRKLKIPEIYLGDRIQSWVHSIDLTENAVQKSGLIELDRDVFGQCLRTDILHRVVLYQMARKRAGTAKQKSKAEVRGGGRKPWHQKGTGRARHGSIRSPLFSGGGRSFPKRPRDFSFGLQKKVRKLAVKIALSQKLRENNLIVLKEIPKTAQKLAEAFKTNGFDELLVIDTKSNIEKNLEFREKFISCSENFHCFGSHRVNVYSLLRLKTVAISVEAIDELSRRLSKFENIKFINAEAEKNLERMGRIKDAEFL